MAKQDIESLRAQARARHKAATRKVSRLRTQKGVELTGTKIDPRRDPHLLKRYTTRQLKAYIAQLDSFVDRKTQFVGDARKRPLNPATWGEYAQLEKQYNAKVRAEFDRIAGLKLPHGDQTIGERMAMMTPTHRAAYDPAVNAPYSPPTRKPKNMASDRALRRLTADMRDRLSPSRQRRDTARDRDAFGKMAELINQPDLVKAVKGLSDAQFRVMWNYTGFATDISLSYEASKSMLTEKERPWHSEAMAIAVKDAHALIKWAKSLDLAQ